MRILLQVLIMFVFALGSSSAFAGNSVNNGGGKVALQVTWTARAAIAKLRKVPLSLEQKKWVDTIARGLDVVRVGSAARVYLNGLEVDARNNNVERTILVSRSGWARMKTATRTTRIGFSLHEFALAMGLDDTKYVISDELVRLLRDDRAGDEAYLEAILDVFVTVKHELMTTYAVAETAVKDGRAVDIRSICRLAGSVRGRSTSLNILLMNPLPWFVSQNPENELMALDRVARNLDDLCRADVPDLRKLEAARRIGIKAIDGLSGRLIPTF